MTARVVEEPTGSSYAAVTLPDSPTWRQDTGQEAVPLTTEAILKERGSRYGSFKDNSRMSQSLSAVLDQECHYRAVRGQEALELHQLEAIEMIFHKIARIVSGDDPTYADNWDDIAGYAQLGKVPR